MYRLLFIVLLLCSCSSEYSTKSKEGLSRIEHSISIGEDFRDGKTVFYLDGSSIEYTTGDGKKYLSHNGDVFIYYPSGQLKIWADSIEAKEYSEKGELITVRSMRY